MAEVVLILGLCMPMAKVLNKMISKHTFAIGIHEPKVKTTSIIIQTTRLLEKLYWRVI
jgi:hypothetical protein